MSRRTTPWISLILLLSLVPVSTVSADDLTVWTHPLGAFVELTGNTAVRGVSPFPLDNRMDGEYYVRARLDGYQESRGIIRLRTRNDRLLLMPEVRSLRLGRFFRSATLPGSGQFFEGRRTAGSIWGGMWAVSGITTWRLDGDYDDARSLYDLSNVVLQQSLSSGDVDPLVLDATLELEVLRDAAKRNRDFALMTMGAFWAGNLIDALFFHQSLDLQEGSGNLLQISLREKNRFRRAIRSALFPGLGQDYAGYSLRGLVYAASAVFVGYQALEAHLNLEEERDRLDALDRELAVLAPNSEEEAAFFNQVEARRGVAIGDRDDVEDRRNAWAIAAAGVWAASVIDAIFTGPRDSARPESTTELGMVHTPATHAPGVAISYRF